MKSLKTAGKTVTLHKDNCPINCRSWNPNADEDGNFNFTFVKELWDESHDQFRLYRCEACKTLYLWHWHEEIGWDGGGDPVSICAKAISDADRVAMQFFEEQAPHHPQYLKFLHAKILGFHAQIDWP